MGLEDIYKDVKLNDHMFEVALCKVQTKKDILRMFYALKKKNVKEIPGITYYQTDHIDIAFNEIPLSSWCVDGEELKHHTNLFHLEVRKGFKMLLPSDNVTKLFNE